MPTTEANGIQLHYEELGEGHPILCIHGMGGSAIVWGDAPRELTRAGRVIAYDRRGCARSERPDPYDSTCIAEQADDAAALLEKLDASPAVVVGRSYGGAVATALAARHPDHVRALVLLEPDAPGLSESAGEWTAKLVTRLRQAAESEGVDGVGQALIEEVLGEDGWSGLPEELRELFTQNGQAILAEATYAGEQLSESDYAALRQPTLVLTATASPQEFRDAAHALVDALPNARLAAVAGGHLIDPASPEVLAFIDEMLRRD